MARNSLQQDPPLPSDWLLPCDGALTDGAAGDMASLIWRHPSGRTLHLTVMGSPDASQGLVLSGKGDGTGRTFPTFEAAWDWFLSGEDRVQMRPRLLPQIGEETGE